MKEERPQGTFTLDQIARIADEEPVPDWLDVMTQAGDAQDAAVKVCARACWLYLSRAAARDTKSERFSPAGIQHSGHVSLDRFTWARSASTAIAMGWRWDGVFTEVMTTLWPSLSGLLGAARNRTDDEVQAGAFRNLVSSYLRYSHNAICINKHGRDAAGRRAPEWFISGQWNDAQPQRPPKPQRDQRLASPAERKLTPAEAGEDRQAAPAVSSWRCRAGTCVRAFTSEDARDAHEPEEHDGLYPCRSEGRCAYAATTPANRSTHERTEHREEFARRWKHVCALCGEPYETGQGLSYHRGYAHPAEARKPANAPDDAGLPVLLAILARDPFPYQGKVRQLVMQQLDCGRDRADNLMAYAQDLGLVEMQIGEGRGKPRLYVLTDAGAARAAEAAPEAAPAPDDDDEITLHPAWEDDDDLDDDDLLRMAGDEPGDDERQRMRDAEQERPLPDAPEDFLDDLTKMVRRLVIENDQLNRQLAESRHSTADVAEIERLQAENTVLRARLSAIHSQANPLGWLTSEPPAPA